MTDGGSGAAGERTSPWRAMGERRYVLLGTTLLAAAALALGLALPVVELRRGLAKGEYSVVTGIADLARGGNVLLALIVLAFSVLFPVVKLTALLVVLFRPLSADRRDAAVRSLSVLGRWSMLDVFVIAILVSAIELGILSGGEPRPGLYVFAAAILLSMTATLATERLAGRSADPARVRELRAAGRAGSWSSVASCALFAVGLSLPLMEVEKWLLWDNEYSVVGGALELWRAGEPPLALTVLVLVVLVPALRFACLAWFWWGPPSERAARAVVAVDKWAMFDVFGLALLVVIVKIGSIASVEPKAGFWVLLAAVALSLLDSWRLQRRAGQEPR